MSVLTFKSYPDDKPRQASLIHFSWFTIDWETQWGLSWEDYEPVTQEFLETLKARLDKQEEKRGVYRKDMVERLDLAWQLYRDLTTDSRVREVVFKKYRSELEDEKYEQLAE